jgi:hypothetical protein
LAGRTVLVLSIRHLRLEPIVLVFVLAVVLILLVFVFVLILVFVVFLRLLTEALAP